MAVAILWAIRVDAVVVPVVYPLDFFPDLVGCCLMEVYVGQHRVDLGENTGVSGVLLGPSSG